MAGFIAAPSPRPKVGFEGQPALTIPKLGLPLVPGVGLAGRTDEAGGRLLLDAARVSPPEEFSLYVPGAVAAGTAGVWQNTRPSGTAELTALEVNLTTAPTSGDASNFYAVKVADASGTNGVLGISSAGVRHYMLNKGDGIKIARYRDVDLSANLYPTDYRAMIQKVTPTQALTVTGFEAACCPVASHTGNVVAGSSGSAVYYAGRIRGVLLDSAGNVLGSAVVNGGTFTNSSQVAATFAANLRKFIFPLSVTLTANATYYVGLELVDNPAPPWGLQSTNDSNAPRLAIGIGQTQPAGQPLDLAGDKSTGLRRLLAGAAYASGLAVDWDDAAAVAGAWAGSGSAYTSNPTTTATPYPVTYALIGSGGTLSLVGDVTLSVQLTGAAPADPGSGINVRALFAAGR